MKLGIAQTHIVWKDKSANLLAMDVYASSAALRGADVLLFPEMSFTGFCMENGEIGETDEHTVKAVSAAARKNGLAIGFGWVKNIDGISENHYSIADKNGKLILDYVKMHPFSFVGEDKHYRHGDSFSFCEISGVRVCVFICYDLRFPRPISIAAPFADLILIPANWPKARLKHFETLLDARAIENQCYFAGINCVGGQSGTEYAGGSRVISPKGEVLMCEYGEGLFFCEIDDLSVKIKTYRAEFPALCDRRGALYDKLERLGG